MLSYNQEGSIARTLDSILAQRLGPYTMEIVVGDDGSADSTRRIAKEYASRHPEIVRLMPHAPNKGVVTNYFDTLAACRGRYIADCSADDYWIWPDKLCLQAGLLDANPTLTMTVTLWAEVSPGAPAPVAAESPVGEAAILSGAELLAPLLAHTSRLHLSTALYRAATAREALADEPAMVRNPEFGCEDLPLMAALLARGDVGLHNVASLAYTVAEGTVSKPAQPARAVRYFVATVECTALLGERYGIDPRRLRGYFADRLVHIAKLALKAGDRESAALARRACATAGFTPFTARLIIDAAELLAKK